MTNQQSTLELLLKLSAQIAKERDLKVILVKMTDITKTLLKADRCSIFLHDAFQQQLWTIIAHGVKEIRIPDNHGIAGTSFQTNQTINIPDAYADQRFDRSIDTRTGYRTRSMLAMPLTDRNNSPIGVFQVINKEHDTPFSPDDISLLQHVGLFASSVIEGAFLYEQLKKAHVDVIYKLSSATKFKDPETKNHIIRVGLYCAKLAEVLGWENEEVNTIKLAAPMHDIGKVGIPDAILQKPAKLDEHEWKIMQKHTLYGYEILRGGESRLLEIARTLALEHHERWNGTGYPHGKKETEISIYGRMGALADVFDALTASRHYKEAWPAEKVKQHILAERASSFDPQLTDLFLDNFHEMVAIRQEYKDT